MAEVEVRSRLLGSPRVDPNEETTRVAGRLLAGVDDDADGDGRIGWNDAYVAAIVTVLDRPVLADNVEDFERLGVAAESY